MAAPDLEVDTGSSLPGKTYHSKGGGWPLQTGIYVPSDIIGDKIDVVLWMHGMYVPEYHATLRSDKAQVREQVVAANKNAVVVAPFFGHKWIGGGNYDLGVLGQAKGVEKYLNLVREALGKVKGKTPTLGNLVFACHSYGGNALHGAVGSLGGVADNLKELWGFDCLYNTGDGKFWATWARGNSKTLYIFFGGGTARESITLELIAMGFADDQGALVDKLRPTIDNVIVVHAGTLVLPDVRFSSMGHSGVFIEQKKATKNRPAVYVSLMEAIVDEMDLLKKNPRKLVSEAVEIVLKYYHFMEHYEVARFNFQARLKASDLFARK